MIEIFSSLQKTKKKKLFQLNENLKWRMLYVSRVKKKLCSLNVYNKLLNLKCIDINYIQYIQYISNIIDNALKKPLSVWISKMFLGK